MSSFIQKKGCKVWESLRVAGNIVKIGRAKVLGGKLLEISLGNKLQLLTFWQCFRCFRRSGTTASARKIRVTFASQKFSSTTECSIGWSPCQKYLVPGIA